MGTDQFTFGSRCRRFACIVRSTIAVCLDVRSLSGAGSAHGGSRRFSLSKSVIRTDGVAPTPRASVECSWANTSFRYCRGSICCRCRVLRLADGGAFCRSNTAASSKRIGSLSSTGRTTRSFGCRRNTRRPWARCGDARRCDFPDAGSRASAWVSGAPHPCRGRRCEIVLHASNPRIARKSDR